MSVVATVQSNLAVVETLETNVPAAGSNGRIIRHDQWGRSHELKASSTPAATKCAYFSAALSSGDGEIDLTQLPGTNGVTVNGNGLKVRAVHFYNPSANVVSVEAAAVDGYALFGSDGKINVNPGCWYTAYLGDAAPAIGGTAKLLKLTGTGSQSLNCAFLLG